MKKIYFLSMAAASLMLASCSNDDMPAPENGDVATVAVSVQLPDGLQTRYGEGETATRLHYAVYAKGTKKPLPVCINGTDKNATEGLATINRSTTLSLQLASGQEYDMVFWADAEESVYRFDAEHQVVTAEYNATDNGTAANQEALDAFYCAKTYKVSGNATISAQLYRPFAQVNIVTDDLEAAGNGGFTPANSSLKTKVATGLNLMDGTVTGDYTEVTFAAASLPTGTMKINGKDYDYIGMNYLLVPAEKSLRDIDFTLYADGTENVETHVYNFNTVPVQRNYRTNIYGSLLTSSQSFNVEILPGFFDPNYEYEVVTSTKDLANLLEQDNSNILINQDITIDQYLTVDHTANIILSEGAAVMASIDRTSVLKVIRKGTLNLNGTGKFVAASNKPNGGNTSTIYCEKGTLNIYGNLTFDGGSGNTTNNAIFCKGGTTNIYGGYFYTGLDKGGKSNACIFVDALNDNVNGNINGYVNIYGGVFECAGDAKYLLNRSDDVLNMTFITVYGGIFVGFNPADNSADGEHTNYVADGYKSVKIDYNGKEAWQVVKE